MCRLCESEASKNALGYEMDSQQWGADRAYIKIEGRFLVVNYERESEERGEYAYDQYTESIDFCPYCGRKLSDD